jgi:hypothetical protein
MRTRFRSRDGKEIVLPREVYRFAVRIADRYGVLLTEVLFGKRVPRPTQNVAHARHELWTVTMDTFGYSYPETGALFGFDHTTIMSGRQEYEARRDKKRRRDLVVAAGQGEGVLAQAPSPLLLPACTEPQETVEVEAKKEK